MQMGRSPRCHVKFLLPNFENPMVRAQPEPAAAVRNNLGNLVVEQSLLGSETAIMPVLKPAQSPARIANPQTAVRRNVERPDGPLCAAQPDRFVGDRVAADFQQG